MLSLQQRCSCCINIIIWLVCFLVVHCCWHSRNDVEAFVVNTKKTTTTTKACFSCCQWLLSAKTSLPLSSSLSCLNNNADEEPSLDMVEFVKQQQQQQPRECKRILIISDSTGSMAKLALRKILFQFNNKDGNHHYRDDDDDDDNDSGDSSSQDRETGAVPQRLETKTFSFVRSEQAIVNILENHASNTTTNTTTSTTSTTSATSATSTTSTTTTMVMVIYTLSDPLLRQAMVRLCSSQNNYTNIVASIDLLGTLFDQMGQFLQQTPVWSWPNPNKKRSLLSSSSTSSSWQPLSLDYFRRMEAVEYTLQADDGRAPWLWPTADVVLVGVSRTGKTPLSVVLSHTMGLRVANVPLVLEVPPPMQQLEMLDSRRVFCLTLAPNVLGKIRQARLERRQVIQHEQDQQQQQATKTNHHHHRRHHSAHQQQSSTYANRNYLLQDLMQARRLARAQNWTEIDVTGRAMEETATLVVELLSERFPTMTLNN